jgi:hypothetical protein
MKMGDGGLRPADKVQFATGGDTQMIVSVDVSNNGSVGGQMAPMHEDVCRRYDKIPDHYTVDCGFATKEDITQVEQGGSQVAAPMTHADRIEERGGGPLPAVAPRTPNGLLPRTDANRRGEGRLAKAAIDRRVYQRRM